MSIGLGVLIGAKRSVVHRIWIVEVDNVNADVVWVYYLIRSVKTKDGEVDHNGDGL